MFEISKRYTDEFKIEALLLGVLLLDEPLNSHNLVAMILILTSIGMVTLGKRLQGG